MNANWTGWAIAVSSLGLLAGCGDPIVGTWNEATPDCSTPSTFTVDDDLKGKATIYVDTQGCQSCTFDFEVEDEGDGKYSGPITVTDPTCASFCGTTGRAGCVLSDDEESADCAVTAGPCSESDTFVKVGD